MVVDNMEDKLQIDYLAHESMLTRMERAQRRLWILNIILILLLAGSWLGFYVYQSQFEDVVITHEVSQDTDNGGNNSYNGEIIGGDYYGDAKS